MGVAVPLTPRCPSVGDGLNSHDTREPVEKILLLVGSAQIVVFSVHNGRFGEAILKSLSYS